MRLFISLLLLGLLFLSACQQAVEEPAPQFDECTVDSDCAIAGCSGQKCVEADIASDIVTTCEWKEEYACFKETTCGCNNGKCGWAQTPEYTECLENVGK